MVGLGTIINTLAILAGGVLGALFGRFLTESTQDTEATGNYSPIQSESTTPEDTTASGGDLR